MPYDLFISYSRRDNQTGHISELKTQIDVDYRILTGEDLHCFFDLTAINAMDDWRNRILGALRESKLLLLVLTRPIGKRGIADGRLSSSLKYEHSRPCKGTGAPRAYFVERRRFTKLWQKRGKG